MNQPQKTGVVYPHTAPGGKYRKLFVQKLSLFLDLLYRGPTLNSTDEGLRLTRIC